MKTFKWFLVNGIFAGFLYLSYSLEIKQAENVLLFFAWINIMLSFLMLTEAMQKGLKKNGRSVPAIVNIIYDLSVTIIFIWFGAWFTGTFWLIHLFVQETAWAKIEKK